MVIDTQLFDELTAQAKASPRLRYSLDLRNSPEDNTQRILNALEPGTVLKIHRHSASSTTVIVLRGCIKQNIYDDAGILMQSEILRPTNKQLAIFEVPQNVWHNLECLESGTIIFEGKDGKYNPETDADFFESK